jgi:outer membrane protein assembly factor BamB
MRIWQVKWFTVVLTLTMISVGQAADWPTYLHDDRRCGATDEQLSLPLTPQWIYSSADQLQLAWEGPRAEPFEGLYMRHRMAFDDVLHAVIADGLAFFGSTVDNKVYAVELDSGEVRWEFFSDGAVRLAPTWADGKIYVGSDDGVVYCLQANSGQLVWKLRAGPDPKMLLARGRMVSRWPIRTGVVVSDGVAYFGAGVFPHETVFLYAVDALQGKILWKNDTISQQDAGRNPLSPQGYLLCSESRLFVPSGRSLPVGFDRETGKQLFQRSHPWRTTAGGVVGGSKALLADGQIYTSGPHHFLAMNQEDGTVGFAWVTGRQMVIGGDRAFVADGTRVVALDRLKHAKATIRRQKLQMEIRSVRANRSKMDATEYNQKLRDLQAQVKELSDVGVMWQVPCSDDAALVLAGNILFAGGEGQVTGWDVKHGQQVWQAKVEGQVGGLAVGNGHLLASTTQGKIYSFAAAAGNSESPRQVTSPKDGELFVGDPQQAIFAQTAEQILDQTGVRRGFCLVLGSGEGAWRTSWQNAANCRFMESKRTKSWPENPETRWTKRVGTVGESRFCTAIRRPRPSRITLPI